MTDIDKNPKLRQAYSAFSEGSYKESFLLFSELDLPEAHYCLGFHYLHGRGTKKDLKSAALWTFRAMNEGYLPAIAETAQMYGYGIGLPMDDIQAFELFTDAAEAGDPYGMGMVSLMYENGDGVKKDHRLAEKWSERCEGSGDMDVYEDRGLEYLVSENVILGRMYLMRSALMGGPVSAKALNIIYAFGIGVDADEEESDDWAETAYFNGWDDVTEKDLKGKEKWFSEYLDMDDLEEE